MPQHRLSRGAYGETLFASGSDPNLMVRVIPGYGYPRLSPPRDIDIDARYGKKVHHLFSEAPNLLSHPTVGVAVVGLTSNVRVRLTSPSR